jgi:hypothetical protein
MKKIVLIQAVAGTLHGSFRRLGRTFTTEGTVVDASEFTEEEWKILAAEKMLHISPAPEGVDAAANADALRTMVKDALGKLEATDFAADGMPKADAVKKALPRGAKGVTAQLVAEVWAEIKAGA